MADEITLTRDQLYEQVWAEPMTKVAARLGLSDVGLAKICYQAEIPVPARGYWAKKRNGKRVFRKRLRKLDKPIEFVFRPQPRVVAPKPPKPEYGEEVDALIAAAKSLPKIKPRTELTDLHPLVERTRVSLGRCTLDENPGFRSECLLSPEPVKGRCVLNIQVGIDSVPRALLILDALLRAVEGIGGQLIETKGAKPDIRLRLLGQDVGGLSISENRRQVRNQKWKEGSWFESRTILVPGGDLSFASTAPYVENRAHDTPKHRLEESLNKIVVRWAENVGRLPTEKRLAEERAARVAEQDRLRREQMLSREALRNEFQSRQQAERQQFEQLKLQTSRWHESRQIRSYVQALRERTMAQHGFIEPGGNLERWCDLAMKQADRLDPLVEAEQSILDMSFEQYESGCQRRPAIDDEPTFVRSVNVTDVQTRRT